MSTFLVETLSIVVNCCSLSRSKKSLMSGYFSLGVKSVILMDTVEIDLYARFASPLIIPFVYVLLMV